MRATSALADFIPRVTSTYSALGGCHVDSKAKRHCTGCQIGAESVFQELMRSWEWFLVEIIVDLMLGHHTAHRTTPYAISRSRYANRTAAQNDLLRSNYSAGTGRVTLSQNPRSYLLLHSPSMVIAVAEHWLSQNPISDEVRNRQSDISDLLTIRHGLAHGTAHAQNEMRAAMLRLDPANHYTSVGEFLLSRSTVTNPLWIDEFIQKICGVVSRISP